MGRGRKGPQPAAECGLRRLLGPGVGALRLCQSVAVDVLDRDPGVERLAGPLGAVSLREVHLEPEVGARPRGAGGGGAPARPRWGGGGWGRARSASSAPRASTSASARKSIWRPLIPCRIA